MFEEEFATIRRALKLLDYQHGIERERALNAADAIDRMEQYFTAKGALNRIEQNFIDKLVRKS